MACAHILYHVNSNHEVTLTPSLTPWQRLVRFGFRLLYHELAFTYDLVANGVSLGQWWEWGRCALRFLPPASAGPILELAYGTGRLQVALQQGGWQAVGMDFSPQMARIAQARLQRQGIPLRLGRAQAQALPFPAQSFNAVVCTFPTPFIIEEATLQEVARVLQPQGRLVFVPTAILTKGGAARVALEQAYQVTGQRGAWGVDLNERMAACGLTLAVHQVTLPRSLVTVMVGQKG
jgi:ubiquinone/menaquinone biosynthesis C-methylase UbiE